MKFYSVLYVDDALELFARKYSGRVWSFSDTDVT